MTLILRCLAGCRDESAEPDTGAEAGLPWPIHLADELWPRPQALKEYKRALSLYEAGDIEEGVSVVRRLVTQPMRLAPEDAWGDDPYGYYSTYASGRESPALAIMRKTWGENRAYANRLAGEGKIPEALEILQLNLSLTEQIVHIEPVSSIALLSGHGLWRATWCNLRDTLAAAGEQEKARLASQCVERAKSFRDLQIKPWVEKGTSQLEDMRREIESLPEEQREAYGHQKSLEILHADQAEVRRLVDVWDAEVAGPFCEQVLADMAGGT